MFLLVWALFVFILAKPPPHTALIMSFNQELIERTVKYFREKHDHEITPETAGVYLLAMADLYGSFIEFAQFDE